MTAKIIDGRKIAEHILKKISIEVNELKSKYNITPNIITIKIGSDPESNLYLRLRDKACSEVGIISNHLEFPQNVSDKEVDLYPYSYDMTECQPKMPDFVVIPENKNQLINLVKLCNSHMIPIVPYISGNNVGGLTIPELGGIIVDFGKKMNRILHVNENMMYALLEPGVTFGQLKKC